MSSNWLAEHGESHANYDTLWRYLSRRNYSLTGEMTALVRGGRPSMIVVMFSHCSSRPSLYGSKAPYPSQFQLLPRARTVKSFTLSVRKRNFSVGSSTEAIPQIAELPAVLFASCRTLQNSTVGLEERSQSPNYRRRASHRTYRSTQDADNSMSA